jgi:glucose-1-phosphate thymidylyltransferase
MGYIDAAQVERLAQPLRKSGYGEYLLQMLEERVFTLNTVQGPQDED